MKISREKLQAESEATGFRAEVLEKVIHLLTLLDRFRSHPFLKNRLALKGGTALNLFFLKVPRLSVDIDLNYLGGIGREAMLAERPKIEQAIQAVCSRENFLIRRVPSDHAGGKWMLRYEKVTGQTGNLEVDINFMFRIPLWPVKTMDSQTIGSYRATGIPVLDIHEIAGGKLAALLARQQARDLFDAHQLLHLYPLDRQRLRLAFVIHGAMNRKDWRIVSRQNLDFSPADLARQLVPLLRGPLPGNQEPVKDGARLVEECRRALGVILPFTEPELEFLNILLDKGEIASSLLTSDVELQERINQHPMLEWKALHVRQHKAGKVSVGTDEKE
jgi:predicted nucleotidyltransferase component of viral defense system